MRDDRIRQARSGPQGAEYANAILANWPLEKLTAERAEAWSNGKVLIVAAYTGFRLENERRSRDRARP